MLMDLVFVLKWVKSVIGRMLFLFQLSDRDKNLMILYGFIQRFSLLKRQKTIYARGKSLSQKIPKKMLSPSKH